MQLSISKIGFLAGWQKNAVDGSVFQIFAFNIIEPLGFSTFALVRPHKKAVKKIEAKGAKEKQLLPKPGSAIGL